MKKSIKALAVAGTIIGLAGAANAANSTYNINLYGASAQFTYWSALAPTFLTSKYGCTISKTGKSSDKKHYIAVGTGCNGTNNDTINFRVSSKASFDGIFAVTNNSTVDTNNLSSNWCNSDPGSRMMADEGQTSGGTVSGLKCVSVNVGASDVAAATFTQQSHGALLGPAGGNQTDRVFNKIPVPSTGINTYRPIVVPFGFFANNSIKVYTCQGGANDGNLCTTATAADDCAGSTCAQNTIGNITREMAVNIFGGFATAWTDFGDSYSVAGDSNNTIVACMRHAGSGTHATLDYAVMRGTGVPMMTDTTLAAGTAYFNDGSADEMNCVNNTTTLATPGAIGYSDADQLTGTGATSYPNAVALKYNGAFGRRTNIRNGVYDFFTDEWLYENTAKANNPHQQIVDLAAFAGNPANLTFTNLGGAAGNGVKASYWATEKEMVFNKSADNNYPVEVGATVKMSP
jgi:hypothetical protein